MINFLDLNRFKKGLTPVTSTELFSKPGEYHPEGLFSEIIFGPVESPERKRSFSYIDLHAQVIHPSAYSLLKRLDMKIDKFISAQESFSLDKDKRLVIDPDGVTGIKEFIKLLPKIKFKAGRSDRERFIKKVDEAYKNGTLFVDIIPVIPPEQRPAYEDEKGMWIIDPINDYYLAIIRRAIQIKSIGKRGALFDLLNFELQRAVLDHDAFVRKIIQKKSGLIRSQLLGKRTDFSGRAVVTPGPDLKVNEIGLPLRMAVSLFEPFLFHRLLNSGQVDVKKLGDEVKKFTNLELSIDSIKAVFKAIKSGDKIPQTLYDMIFEAAEVVSMNRTVLAKRDPVLHAESVRGFKVKIIHGNTINLCTLQVKGFNADFDGDTMAVFHPITDEAQEEVKSKMLRSESGDNHSSVNFVLTKEMGAGLFTMTKLVKRKMSPIAVSKKDLEEAKDPYIPVKYRGKTTTMGRAIFNSAFPPGYPFFDDIATLPKVNAMIPEMLEKYGQEQAIETFSKLKDYAFKFATIISPTLSLDNLDLPDDILKMKAQLEGASTEEADLLLKKIEQRLKEHLKGTGIYDLVESGSAKGWLGPRQILVAKGLAADPQGNVLEPIKGSFSDGLTNTEYFKAASGARKGIIDRVLNTADTGYMSRQLAFLLNTVEIHNTLRDCKTTRTLNLRLDRKLMSRLKGRYVLNNRKVEEFKSSDYKTGDVINLRSPVFCESPKLCHTCYGKLLERHRSPYAGIVAAQIVGEAGTQTIMRTFHTGGAVSVVQKDMIGDLVSNDPMTSKNVVTSHLSQSENTLVAKKDCVVTLNTSDYPLSGDLVVNEVEGNVTAKALVASVEFSDAIFSMILDYPVTLQIEEMEKFARETIKLTYKANSTILESPLETAEVKQQIRYVQRLLSGREISKDATHIYRKLFKVYEPLTASDSVHLEVLLSQVLRDANNLSLPARLGKTWNPVQMNMKQIVFNTSFIQGLAFENINEAIRTGLISEETPDQSIIEKILTGELVEKKRR